MDTLAQNFRLALRRLVRSPGFTLVAVLTLALGIGANTAIFSVVDGALFRALPFPHADDVARIYSPARSGRGTASAPDFFDWRRDSHAFRAMAAITQSTFALSGGGVAEQRGGAYVTGDFFTVLGVRPALGRAIGADDAIVGAPPVVVLSDGVWRGRFGADPTIVGRQITMDGVRTTVIGVMPPGFDYPESSDLWRPIAFTPQELATQRGAHYLDVIGRLAPGATLDAARSEIAAIQARLSAEYPSSNSVTTPGQVVTLRTSLYGDARRPLFILLGAVGLLLLVACANVANLLLARAIGRQREIAVRTALGASRGRIARELLAESVTLSLLGGALGLLLASWATQAFGALLPNDRLVTTATVDTRMLVATAVLSVVTGIVFGLFPALQMSRGGDLGVALAGGGRGASASASAQRAKRALAVAELALSVVLLTSAGLLLRSFVTLRAVDPGFVTDHRLAFGVSLPDARYDTPEKSAAFMTDLLGRLQSRPGVREVGATSLLPLDGNSFSITAWALDGRQLPDAEADRLTTGVRVVTPDYFRAMGIPVKEGRGITSADRFGAPNVVVMNESAARLVFPGGSALGHQYVIGTTFGLKRGRAGGEVVGIVGDTRDDGLDRPAQPAIYLAHDQYPVGSVRVVVHTTGEPAAAAPFAREALAAIDRDVPLFQAQSMNDVAMASIARPRFLTTLLGIFAAVAATLAAIGLYGVIAYAVGERTREIGIRVALGAREGDVLRLVLGGGLALAVAGVAIGLAGSLASARLLRGLLFGVQPVDAPTFALTAALVLGVALLATWLPARRAARLDPVEALRVE